MKEYTPPQNVSCQPSLWCVEQGEEEPGRVTLTPRLAATTLPHQGGQVNTQSTALPGPQASHWLKLLERRQKPSGKVSQLLVFLLPAKLFQGIDPGRQPVLTELLYAMFSISLGPCLLGGREREGLAQPPPADK